MQPNACPAERAIESVLGHLEKEGGGGTRGTTNPPFNSIPLLKNKKGKLFGHLSILKCLHFTNQYYLC